VAAEAGCNIQTIMPAMVKMGTRIRIALRASRLRELLSVSLGSLKFTL